MSQQTESKQARSVPVVAHVRDQWYRASADGGRCHAGQVAGANELEADIWESDEELDAFLDDLRTSRNLSSGWPFRERPYSKGNRRTHTRASSSTTTAPSSSNVPKSVSAGTTTYPFSRAYSRTAVSPAVRKPALPRHLVGLDGDAFEDHRRPVFRPRRVMQLRAAGDHFSTWNTPESGRPLPEVGCPGGAAQAQLSGTPSTPLVCACEASATKPQPDGELDYRTVWSRHPHRRPHLDLALGERRQRDRPWRGGATRHSRCRVPSVPSTPSAGAVAPTLTRLVGAVSRRQVIPDSRGNRRSSSLVRID